MQYRFRYQPKNGPHMILDVPARIDVELAFAECGCVDFDIKRIFVNEVEVPAPTGLHEDIHDHVCTHHAAAIIRMLEPAGKNATAVFAAIG